MKIFRKLDLPTPEVLKKMLDEYIDKLDVLYAAKEKEIMEV